MVILIPYMFIFLLVNGEDAMPQNEPSEKNFFEGIYWFALKRFSEMWLGYGYLLNYFVTWLHNVFPWGDREFRLLRDSSDIYFMD